MANQGQDEAFARYVLQSGVVRLEHLETARAEQERSGKPLAEILVALGAITPLQRQDIEKRVEAGTGEAPPQLGNYRLLCKLGEGGMGSVYLCEDTLLNRQVALKLLPKDVTENPELLSRFRREAVAAGKLNHAGIATAYAVGEEAGRHFYAMEYCRGEPLDKMLKRLKHLPERQILELMIAVAKAMQYAHEHGILHRDLKPGNIMRGLDGSVKVLDLGLSKNVADQEQSFQTTSGLAIGTPHYISPEQARGEKVVDGRTDIYSLGATMFHLATGRTPYAGSTAAVIMTRHLNDPVPDPRSVIPELSDAFASVVQKAMSKKPADRYVSMNDFAADMERLLAGQPVRASLRKAVHGSARGSGVAAASERPSGRHDALRKSRSEREGTARRRNPALLWGGTALAAVLVGIGLFLYQRGGFSVGPVAPPEPRLPVAPKPPDPLPPPDVPKPPDPQPPVLSAEEQAQAAFAKLFDGLAPADRQGRIGRLEDFLAKHGATLVGARARVLLEEARRDSVPGKAEARWQPLFDGRTVGLLVAENAGNWLVENGMLTNRPGSNDSAQTRRDFADGQLRLRFSVTGATYLRFTVRQGREGGYTVAFDRNALAQMRGDHELIFTCRGAAVTATLDGKTQSVQGRGAPLSGRLQFGLPEGRIRVAAVEFAALQTE